MRRTLFCALSLALGLIMQSTASAAVDMFLKLDGIDGESTAQGHEQWIETDSFAFGASQGAQGSGSGQATGKTTLSEVSITKAIDTRSVPEPSI